MNAKIAVKKMLHTATPQEIFMDDLHAVMADANELLHATANQTGEAATAARSRIQQSMQTVKSRIAETEAALMERTRQAAKVTDQYVHENPWQSIGIAAVAGVVVGMLVARR